MWIPSYQGFWEIEGSTVSSWFIFAFFTIASFLAIHADLQLQEKTCFASLIFHVQQIDQSEAFSLAQMKTNNINRVDSAVTVHPRALLSVKLTRTKSLEEICGQEWQKYMYVYLNFG